jgi:hypothetical protein
MSPADAVKQAVLERPLEMELACGDVKLVRRRRVGVEIFVRGDSGNYPRKPAIALDEIEAADLNNKLDELLRQ